MTNNTYQIKLYNRYNDEIFLTKEEKYWKLHLKNIEHLRVGFDPKNIDDIDFVDPPGGPFIEVNNFTINVNDKKEILKEIILPEDSLEVLLRFEPAK